MSGELDQLRAKLEAHYAVMPRKPRRVKLIYNNATPSAIQRGMDQAWPSIGLISDEGSGLLKGRMVADLSLPNSMWGGTQITFDRVDAMIVIPEPRFTFSIQIQPGPLQRYYECKGAESRDTGFDARFLVCYPQSTQGGRYIQNPVMTWEHLPKFNTRIRELLEMGIGLDGEPVKKISLELSPEAQDRWIRAYNAIEADINPGGYYSEIKEHAAKIADNLARLAALFHLFEGKQGPILLETLEQAITIMRWYSEEFVRMFSLPPPVPQVERDALSLEIFIAQQIMRANSLVNVKRSYIQQYGPNSLRGRERLSIVLDCLFAGGKIDLRREGKALWIIPSPIYFSPHQVQLLCNQGVLR